MRALLAIPLLFIAEALAVNHQFVSPNGEFEAYTTAANEDGTGMKLYLRRANSRDTGVLLRQNERWIDAKWSPDSQFLAVIDHPDGHISDVYVFGVAAANVAPTLLYHTPGLHKYEVKWEVTGWDVARRHIILDKEVKHEMPGRITHDKIEAPVGAEPLKYEPTE
ncbi:MAG: hypothetical protein WCE87_09775 [Candidatus Udaeobacter sp.]